MKQYIEGVKLKALTTHPDERGFFREIIRSTDDFFSEGFGQWSHSKMVLGTIKAWHIHERQTDWWYVPVGKVKAVTCDRRPGSDTFGEIAEYFLGQDCGEWVLKIPPGIAHGLKVVDGPAHLFYITSHVYDPDDEGRIPYNTATIKYDWLKEQEIT